MAQQTAIILAIAHHAGGVGKTTTTLNLGYELARSGKRVCLVDLDPQGNLSDRLHVTPVSPTLADALAQGKLTPTPVTCTWDDVSLDIIPGDLAMAAAEMTLVVVTSGREKRLANALASLARRYDYILIDCPPSLSLLTVNAFNAASGVLITVQSHDKAYKALPLVLSTIDDVSQYVDVGVFGLLVTMTGHSNIEKQIPQFVLEDYPTLAFQTTIPRLAAFIEDGRWAAPIGVYQPGSKGAEAYRQLADEVLARSGYPVLEDAHA